MTSLIPRRSASLLRNALETFWLRGGIFVLGVATNIVVSRALGPDGRGHYALATLSALTVVALTKLGLEHANIYLLGTLGVAPVRLASQNALVALGAGIPGIMAVLLASVVVPSIFSDLAVGDLALASLAIPFLLHLQLAAGLQNMTGFTTWQFRAALGAAGAQLVTVGALLIAGVLSVTTALAANLMAAVLVWALVVIGGPSGATAPRMDLVLLKRTLGYALIVHVGLVLLFFQTRVTLFLVEALMGTTALGYYSLAVSIAEAALLAADSVAIALLPRQTQASLGAAALMGLRAAAFGAFLVALAGVSLAVFGLPVISFVFGSQFGPSYTPLVVLLPGMFFFAIQRFCGVPALRANRPLTLAAIYVIGVSVNIALDVLWIPAAGLVGAAASTSVSYLVTSVLFLGWTLKMARTRDVAQAR